MIIKNFLIFILVLILGGLVFGFYNAWAQTAGITATILLLL